MNEQPKIKWEPHKPRKLKCIPWMVCSVCGLVYLNNERTNRAIQKGHETYLD